MTKTRTKDLYEKAIKFHEQTIRFYHKHYPTYLNELEKFAKLHGFSEGWDYMITELKRDLN